MKLFLRPLVPAALALCLAGCGGLIPSPQADPTHYYILSGPAVPAPDATAPGRLRIGLKSVELAAYLKSPDLIVRQGTNELVLVDYARWGEPLDAGIARILRERLRAAPAVGRLYPQPFPLDADRDYDVAVTVLRCEAGPAAGGGRAAQFAATIELTTVGPDARVVARRDFVAPPIPWNGTDYARLAADLGADADALGREVAGMLPAAP
jgi:uncharacterized lipoprotein YmbA